MSLMLGKSLLLTLNKVHINSILLTAKFEHIKHTHLEKNVWIKTGIF